MPPTIVEVRCEGGELGFISDKLSLDRPYEPYSNDPFKRQEQFRKEAASKLFRHPEGSESQGKIGIPSWMLLSTLNYGGQFVNYPALGPKTKVSTATKHRVREFLTLLDDFLPFDLEGEEIDWERGWQVQVSPLHLPKRHSIAVPVIRAYFPRWGFVVRMSVNTSVVDLELVKKLFEVAGLKSGVGGRRPAIGGGFGKFIVKSSRVVESTARSLAVAA